MYRMHIINLSCQGKCGICVANGRPLEGLSKRGKSRTAPVTLASQWMKTWPRPLTRWAGRARGYRKAICVRAQGGGDVEGWEGGLRWISLIVISLVRASVVCEKIKGGKVHCWSFSQGWQKGRIFSLSLATVLFSQVEVVGRRGETSQLDLLLMGVAVIVGEEAPDAASTMWDGLLRVGIFSRP